MLFWLVSAGVLVLLLSITSLFTARRWSEWSWGQRLLLVFTGPVDGVLVGLLLAWLGASDVTVAAGTVLFGTMSMLFVQPLLVPERPLAKRELLVKVPSLRVMWLSGANAKLFLGAIRVRATNF